MNGRRLAGAVVAEKAEDLALGDSQGDPIDRAHVLVVLAEILDRDHRQRPQDASLTIAPRGAYCRR